MSIEVVCPSCETSHKVKDESAGKKLKCKGCQKILAVPSQAESADGDPWDNLDENEGGEELPPAVRQSPASKRMAEKRIKSSSRDGSDAAVERTFAARKFGISMMIFGTIAMPVFDNGTSFERADVSKTAGICTGDEFGFKNVVP